MNTKRSLREYKKETIRLLRIRLQILALRLERNEGTGVMSDPDAVESMNLSRDIQTFHQSQR